MPVAIPKADFTIAAGQLVVRAADQPAWSPNAALNRSLFFIFHCDESSTLGVNIAAPLAAITSCQVVSVLEARAQVSLEAFDSANRIFKGGSIGRDSLLVLADGNASKLGNGDPILRALKPASMVRLLEETSRSLIFNGYAGWKPGRLEAEAASLQAWGVVEATHAGRLLFDVPPEKRWEEGIKLADFPGLRL